MKKVAYSDEFLKEAIEQEGFSYAIQHYLDSDNIKDKETKKLWKAAEEALNALATKLKLDEE